MKNIQNLRKPEFMPFTFMLLMNIGLMVTAFIVDSPSDVFSGFLRIVESRSILVTDYIEVGGIGAALLNVSIVGISCVLMLVQLGVKPKGNNIMAVWLSIGFAFFGKNVFNMVPLTIGVWLFSKYCKSSFSNYYLSAMLVATVSPTISEVAFLGLFSRPLEITAGILMGFFVGFIFPAISADSVKVHSGFNLYNMGFAGGLVATLLATGYRSLGIEIVPAAIWSSGNNVFFAVMLYTISVVMLLIGLFFDSFATKDIKKSKMIHIKTSLIGFGKTHQHSGRLVSDYYALYGNSVFINMAALCAFGTTVVLILGADLNGPALAGILTMTGFGTLGKHLRNVIPIMAGAVLSALANRYDVSAPNNMIMILFSTGLAPVAGMFGWVWGIIAGFLHVNVAMYVSGLNSGLNLYNNGFAATFVVMFLLPIITVFKRDSYFKLDKYK